jgi:hypothetical protein
MNGVGVRAVQRDPDQGTSLRWRAVASRVLTGLAALLVVLVLNAPNGLRLADIGPTAFLRLPLEALAFLALILALPPHLARTRTMLAVTAGALLGLTAVLKILDMGFIEALNRPFDTLIDWRYAGSFIELVTDSAGGSLGVALLVAAGVLALALLVLLPLSVLRLTRVAVRHREVSLRVVAALAPVWLVLALLGVNGAAGEVASRDTASYVYGQVSRIPSELEDQRRFAEAAGQDPFRDVPAEELLNGLRGKDVLIVFVESLGRVSLEGPAFSDGINDVLDAGTGRLERAGFASRSGFLTSPTFGALSWLAHATLQSGLWVDSQQRYDELVTSPRLTLSRLFARAGWRTVGDLPANTRDWPQGEFYGYDHIYDSRNVGYEGPRFGYPTMPDQYTLDAFHRLELAEEDRPPVMAEIDLVTSHAPWSRTPRMVPQSLVGDGSIYQGMPETLPSETEIWPDPDKVRAAYGNAIGYSLTAVLSFLTTYGDDDLVVVMLGDHQPATIVSGPDAGNDVPVSVIAADPAVLDRISHWGWDDGLRPDPDAPVWRMDEFRDRFLSAYGQTEP